MSRYRKVDPRIWNDAKFRALSDQGKLGFFFLLTHPHMTGLGAMRATLPGLAAEIGWSEKAYREAFADALSKGMVENDEKAALIWLPKFLKYNPPESPNVVKAWPKWLDFLPECPLLSRVVASSVAYLEVMTKGFAEALPEAFGKAMPIHEHEHEHEQEQKDLVAQAHDSKPAKRSSQIPDDFNPDESGVDLSASLGVSIGDELPKFIDYWKGKGEARKDWQATWRNWIRNAAKFANERNGRTQATNGNKNGSYHDSVVAAGKAIFGDLSNAKQQSARIIDITPEPVAGSLDYKNIPGASR